MVGIRSGFLLGKRPMFRGKLAVSFREGKINFPLPPFVPGTASQMFFSKQLQSRAISPLTHLFSAIYRGYNSTYNW